LLLKTNLSVARRCLANVNVSLAHALTNRASVLSTAMPRFAARSVILSSACELGVPASAAISAALAKSLLDGTGLESIPKLCRPLVALRCDPAAGFKSLTEIKGLLTAQQARDPLP
jgi:hypothetical protein